MVKAKILGFALLLVLISFQTFFGQEKTATPPITIDFELTQDDVSKWNMPGSNMSTMMPGTMNTIGNAPNSSQLVDKQVQLNVKCKNTSSKTITAIYWESRFLDAENKPIVLEFKADKKIDPGKEKKFEQECKLDIKKLPPEVRVGLRITKIEFDKDKNNKEKSFWETTTVREDETSYVFHTYRLN